MSDPRLLRELHELEAAAGWALLMAMLSGAIIGAGATAVLLGQLGCGG